LTELIFEISASSWFYYKDSSDPPRSGIGFTKYKCGVLTAAPAGFVVASLTRAKSTQVNQ
jgi:hypothetical protein